MQNYHEKSENLARLRSKYSCEHNNEQRNINKPCHKVTYCQTEQQIISWCSQMFVFGVKHKYDAVNEGNQHRDWYQLGIIPRTLVCQVCRGVYGRHDKYLFYTVFHPCCSYLLDRVIRCVKKLNFCQYAFISSQNESFCRLPAPSNTQALSLYRSNPYVSPVTDILKALNKLIFH